MEELSSVTVYVGWLIVSMISVAKWTVSFAIDEEPYKSGALGQALRMARGGGSRCGGRSSSRGHTLYLHLLCDGCAEKHGDTIKKR